MNGLPNPPPGLAEDASFERKREWNRNPLTDLFPRIPTDALERILDICFAKSFFYNLSQSRLWNARHYTSIVIAHVRHKLTDYDALLREQNVERFEARRRTSAQVWKVLREWCPWDSSNEVLERCFNATLLRREDREAEFWDPMDLDSDEEVQVEVGDGAADDPMDLD